MGPGKILLWFLLDLLSCNAVHGPHSCFVLDYNYVSVIRVNALHDC